MEEKNKEDPKKIINNNFPNIKVKQEYMFLQDHINKKHQQIQK